MADNFKIRRVTLRLTEKDFILLKENAELAGLSVSELIRRRYFGRPIVPKANLAMIRELRRLGGLLKHIYSETYGQYNKEIGSTLNEIQSYIARLNQ